MAHDNIDTKYYGPVKVLRCTKCPEYFYVYGSKVLMLLAAAGIREHWDDLVQTTGLIALGVPLAQVENLTGRKQETIWTRFQKCRDSVPLWQEITSELKRWNFGKDAVVRLNGFTPQAKDHDSPFHVAFVLTPQPNLTCGAGLLKQREQVRRKVEEILQREVAYTGSGEFHFADMDAGQIPWVRLIREASSGQLNGLEEFFYEIASHIRYPNAESHDVARRKAIDGKTAPVLSLVALCEGFYKKVPLPIFLDAIKGIATFLKVSN